MNPRAFLDIDIGDPLKFSEETEALDRATKFYKVAFQFQCWSVGVRFQTSHFIGSLPELWLGGQAGGPVQ
jgi:hypothetical protein